MSMSDETIRAVLDRYEAAIEARSGETWAPWALHLRQMLPKMRAMLPSPTYVEAPSGYAELNTRREKVMRWLGFVQGVLWLKGCYTIDELRAHNMPAGETFRPREVALDDLAAAVGPVPAPVVAIPAVTTIRAPFTAEQVEQLNTWQLRGLVHPFTCPRRLPDGREVVLVATTDGWRCPDCDYRQAWAHAFMAAPS